MKLAEVDRRKLMGLLEELARGVEGLLLSGLTTASESTRRTLDVSFQEASRLRLLRLGATLRTAAEELGKFLQNREDFSRKRLVFFLTRAWLLSQGLLRALQADDEKEFDRLLRSPLVGGVPVERVEVVTLGVGRKVMPGSFCAFDFRLRCLTPAGPIPQGGRLLWSCLIPLKPGVQAEVLLHLPQKQGFKPQLFVEGNTLTLSQVTVTPDENGGGRLTLGDGSTVAAGAGFTGWSRFRDWNPTAALERLQAHRPGPLDLEVELQEEVVLQGWKLGAPTVEEEGQVVYPLTAGRALLHAVASPGDEGAPLRAALDGLRKQPDPPPLFGLLHYERCRLVFQPLATFGPAGMTYLTLSREKVNMASLLKTMKF